MTIINTTFVTDHSVETEVLDWIKSTYTTSARQADRTPRPHMIARVAESPTPDANAFAVHITFPDITQAREWDEKFGMRLRNIAEQRWGEKALSFVTYLQVIG